MPRSPLSLDPALLAHLSNLSEEDEKTLTQLALKLNEEAGELAQAVLSFTRAPGNATRRKTLPDVAEETVDVLLCTWAMLTKLGVTQEFVEDLVRRKAVKWKFKMDGDRAPLDEEPPTVEDEADARRLLSKWSREAAPHLRPTAETVYALLGVDWLTWARAHQLIPAAQTVALRHGAGTRRRSGPARDCSLDTDGDGNCPVHPAGRPARFAVRPARFAVPCDCTPGTMTCGRNDCINPRKVGCPDGGTCHHGCTPQNECFRVGGCSPLSPLTEWPEDKHPVLKPQYKKCGMCSGELDPENVGEYSHAHRAYLCLTCEKKYEADVRSWGDGGGAPGECGPPPVLPPSPPGAGAVRFAEASATEYIGEPPASLDGPPSPARDEARRVFEKEQQDRLVASGALPPVPEKGWQCVYDLGGCGWYATGEQDIDKQPTCPRGCTHGFMWWTVPE